MADPERAAYLAWLARENPYRFFTFADIAEMFGLGQSAMTAIVAAGAPVVARKINPGALSEWLKDNSNKIGKINPSESTQEKNLRDSTGEISRNPDEMG